MMVDIYIRENKYYFLASYIPASKFASLEHNCDIFETQLPLLFFAIGQRGKGTPFTENSGKKLGEVQKKLFRNVWISEI